MEALGRSTSFALCWRSWPLEGFRVSRRARSSGHARRGDPIIITSSAVAARVFWLERSLGISIGSDTRGYYFSFHALFGPQIILHAILSLCVRVLFNT